MRTPEGLGWLRPAVAFAIGFFIAAAVSGAWNV
jgi:hypothetical protein